MSLQLPLPTNDVEFTIYYKSGCPFSERAVKLLKNGINNKTKSPITFAAYEVKELFKYVYPDLDYYNAKQKLQKDLGDVHNTFPIVFCRKTFIGGLNDLKNILDNLKYNKKKYFSIKF